MTSGMAGSPSYFDAHSEPVEQRIATGLHKLGLAMKQQNWLLAHEEGLSPTQGQILAVLSVEGPKTGSELGTALGLTLPTISEAVKVLVEKDWVTKGPDPRHPRASLVTLTASGRRVAKRARSWPEFLASAVGTMSADEQGVFLGGLVKMMVSLQDAGQIPTLRMCASCVYFQPGVHAGPRPHHCRFVDAPLAVHQLRVDCGEHEAASPEVRRATLAALSRPGG